MEYTITLIYNRRQIAASLYKGCELTRTILIEDMNAKTCAETIAEKLSLKEQKVETVICPGGCLKPLMAGCYGLTEQAVKEAAQNVYGMHRYNHLMEICWETARLYSAAAYLADAMSIDELLPLNRIGSHAKVKKYSRGYALEHRAAMAKADPKGRWEDKNYIAVHIDDFVSVGAYEHGRCLDMNDAIGAEGPMGFTSSGDVPCGQMADYFCKSSVSYEEIQEQLLYKSGILQYLGTDCPHKLDEKAAGEEGAALIVKTFAYQIAKWIGSSALVLKGKVDGVLLSGRGVQSQALMEQLCPRIGKIAPVLIEKELDLSGYLAAKAELIHAGLCPARQY